MSSILIENLNDIFYLLFEDRNLLTTTNLSDFHQLTLDLENILTYHRNFMGKYNILFHPQISLWKKLQLAYYETKLHTAQPHQAHQLAQYYEQSLLYLRTKWHHALLTEKVQDTSHKQFSSYFLSAFAWYHYAAHTSCPDALYNLGRFLQKEHSTQEVVFNEQYLSLEHCRALRHYQSLHYLYRAARLYHPPAMHTLGMMYLHSPESQYASLMEQQGHIWLGKAAARGYIDSKIALTHQLAITSKTMYKRYKTLLERYADQQHPYALVSLGHMYCNNEFIASNISQATYFYQQAAQVHDPIALYCLGNIAFTQEEFTQMQSYYTQAYMLGNIHALYASAAARQQTSPFNPDEQFNDEEFAVITDMRISSFHICTALAHHHKEGKYGCIPHTQVSSFWYTRAKNVPPLQNSLPIKVEKEEPLSIAPPIILSQEQHILTSIANKKQLLQNNLTTNDIPLLLELGQTYHTGNMFIPSNFAQAKYYYTLASELGSAQAMLELGNLSYYNTPFTSTYKQEAQKWYEKAIEAGDMNAHQALGHLYHYSNQPDSIKQASTHYHLAAKHNNTQAMFCLGTLYYHGLEVEQNHQQAHTWWQQAAQLNNPLALEHMGDNYFYGLYGYSKNYVQAVEYYKRILTETSSPTNYLVMMKIGDLYSTGGYGVQRDYFKAIVFYTRALDCGYSYIYPKIEATFTKLSRSDKQLLHFL